MFSQDRFCLMAMLALRDLICDLSPITSSPYFLQSLLDSHKKKCIITFKNPLQGTHICTHSHNLPFGLEVPVQSCRPPGDFSNPIIPRHFQFLYHGILSFFFFFPEPLNSIILLPFMFCPQQFALLSFNTQLKTFLLLGVLFLSLQTRLDSLLLICRA